MSDVESDGGQGFLSEVVASVPDSWRAKIARGVLQLLLGTEHGVALYSEGRRRLDHIESRSAVDRRLAEVVAEQAAQDPAIVERYKARLLSDLFQGQQNLEAVISGAVQHLPALPPPDSSENSDETVSNEPGQQGSSTQEPPPLDKDWAAAFTAYAEKASSEDLRDRLSRILAGEITRPGSFPRSAVRALIELEQSDLQAMQRILPYILGDAVHPDPKPDQKPTIAELLPLVDAGLVMESSASKHRFWGLADDRLDDAFVFILGTGHGLAIGMRPGGRIKHDMIPLTRAGQAVVELLGRGDERPILRNIAERADKTHVISIDIGARVGQSTIRVEERLYAEPSSIENTPNGFVGGDN